MPAAHDVAKPARKFHFISGLPRSGSTLLAAILNQNPRFRAGMTSPLADIMGMVIAEASSKNDFSFDVSDEQRVAMLRGLVENFYAGQADAGVVFDTNDAIPEGPSYYYTYAGEMPFSSIPGLPVVEEREDDSAEYMVSADRWSKNGVAIDIPVQKYSWESYHSVVNQNSGSSLPSKLLCEALSLRYRANKLDLRDASGVASLYRRVGEYGSQVSGSFCYLRRDLIDSYLRQSGKALVWLMWGERGFHHRSAEVRNLREYYASYQHIHKRTHVYQTTSST